MNVYSRRTLVVAPKDPTSGEWIEPSPSSQPTTTVVEIRDRMPLIIAPAGD
jgi:hypothetical protein